MKQTINVYVGKNVQSNMAMRADIAVYYTSLKINLSTLTNLIKGYSKKNSYKVVLDNVLFALTEVLSGRNGKDVLTLIEQRTWLSVDRYTKRYDACDLVNAVRSTERAGIDLYCMLNGKCHKLTESLDKVLAEGNTIGISNWHTPQSIGTFISYANRYMKAHAMYDELPSSYFGNDSSIKLYKDEPLTIVLDDIKLYGIRDYYLDEKVIRLNKEGNLDWDGEYVHSNLHVNIINKGESNIYSSTTLRHSSLGDVHNGAFAFEHKYVFNQMTNMIGLQTSIVRKNAHYVIGTKWNRTICYSDQYKLAIPRSFVNAKGDYIFFIDHLICRLDMIDAVKYLAECDRITAPELDQYLGEAGCLSYKIKFDSDNLDIRYSQRDKYLAAILKLRNMGYIQDIKTIKFRHEPEFDRLYEDSDRAEEADEYVYDISECEYEGTPLLEYRIPVEDLIDLDIDPEDDAIITVVLKDLE